MYIGIDSACAWDKSLDNSEESVSITDDEGVSYTPKEYEVNYGLDRG
jgi:hypothetical protein